MKTLNVGCGRNTNGTHFIDLYPRNKDTIKWNGNKEKIPFEDNYFDKVFCSCFLENISNVGLLFNEMSRVLKPNGKIEIYIDNLQYWTFLFDRCLNNNYDKLFSNGNGDTHYCNLTEKHIENYFKENKIELDNIQFYKEGELSQYNNSIKGLTKRFTGFILRGTGLWRMSYMTIKVEGKKC